MPGLDYFVVNASSWDSMISAVKGYHVLDTIVSLDPTILNFCSCIIDVPKKISSKAADIIQKHSNVSVYAEKSELAAKRRFYATVNSEVPPGLRVIE